MTKLYIANCTKQTRVFHYRLPEGGPKSIPIDIGSQVRIPGVESTEAANAVIEQHRVYGIRSVDDARKTKVEFTGVVYSIDKPVSIENMQIVLRLNDDELNRRGQKMRAEAAVAAAQNTKQNENLQGNGPKLAGLEQTITEIRKDGGEPEVQEGVRVDNNAPEHEQTVTGNQAKAELAGNKKRK